MTDKKTEVKNIVTRFAPSPTGFLHVGSARTALFNFLYARKHGGKFILRIEDTDKERSKKEFEDNILDGLKWLGISYDETYHQSERAGIHKKYLQKMIEDGSAYEAEESKELMEARLPSIDGSPTSINPGKKDGIGEQNQRKAVIRFKNPNTRVKFHDLIRGDIEFDTTDLGDFVIAKNIDTPLFHLAVVVDDFEMGITHIIRGEDHISNTPRQILIQRAIGAQEPQYAHIPLILATDRSKLSKRHGAVSVTEYKEQGYLPEAVVNFLALIGWNPGDEREVFTMEELVKEFSLEKVQKGGAIFNTEKLDWVNKEHLKKLPEEEIKLALKERLPEVPLDIIQKITPIVLERINKWSDIDTMNKNGELEYFFSQPDIDIQKLVWKETPSSDTKKHLERIIKILQGISQENFTAEKTKEAIWDYATGQGRGSVLWPMRYTLSGRDKSPDPFTLAELFGKEETIKRLQVAVGKLT